MIIFFYHTVQDLSHKFDNFFYDTIPLERNMLHNCRGVTVITNMHLHDLNTEKIPAQW